MQNIFGMFIAKWFCVCITTVFLNLQFKWLMCQIMTCKIQWQRSNRQHSLDRDSDCSPEIKRHLFLGRKVMTNLDSVLKSWDIALPTKFRITKAIVFPVVMYRCESWTIKKAECRRINAFELWCQRRLLRVPWTAMKSNQSTLKEISPEC